MSKSHCVRTYTHTHTHDEADLLSEHIKNRISQTDKITRAIHLSRCLNEYANAGASARTLQLLGGEDANRPLRSARSDLLNLLPIIWATSASVFERQVLQV